jgi:lipopolysaccharide export LptBFGC system permease protein LptF
MPNLSSRPLLRRLVVSFAIALLALTTILTTVSVTRQIPRLGHEASVAATATLILLSVPFVAAMTIPMAVFVAVLWSLSRLRREQAIESVRQTRGSLRPLLGPVIGFGGAVALLALLWNAEVVPRTNARLTAVIVGSTPEHNDRSMTLGELRAATRAARAASSAAAATRIARYEIEWQKKFSLAAACAVLALVAAAIGLRFPRGGSLLVVAASLVVFSVYYVGFIGGETLANRLAISPVLAMWGPNVLVALAAILLTWRGNPRDMSGAARVSRSSDRESDPGNDTRPLAFAPR